MWRDQTFLLFKEKFASMKQLWWSKCGEYILNKILSLSYFIRKVVVFWHTYSAGPREDALGLISKTIPVSILDK